LEKKLTFLSPINGAYIYPKASRFTLTSALKNFVLQGTLNIEENGDKNIYNNESGVTVSDERSTITGTTRYLT